MGVLQTVRKWSLVVGITDHLSNKFYKCLSVIPFVSVAYYIFFEILFIIANILTLDMAKEMDIFYAFAAYLKCFLDVVWLWPRRKIFYYVIKKIEHLVHRRSYGQNDEVHGMYAQAEKYSHLITITYMYYIIFAATGSSVMPVIIVVFRYFNGQYQPDMWYLALKAKIPFIEQDRLPGYVIAFTLAHISIMSLVLIYAWVPAFFSNTCLYIIAFVKDLTDHIRTISKNTLKTKEGQETFIDQIRGDIQFHQEILQLLEVFSSLMTGLIFISFVADVIILCAGLFHLVLIFDATEVNAYMFQAIAASLGSLLQISFFSFFGDLVMTSLMQISVSVYMDTDWYKYPPDVQRHLIFIMQRSQKLFVFQGFGFDVLRCSRENFTSILTVSMRLLAVVKTLFFS